MPLVARRLHGRGYPLRATAVGAAFYAAALGLAVLAAFAVGSIGTGVLVALGALLAWRLSMRERVASW